MVHECSVVNFSTVPPGKPYLYFPPIFLSEILHPFFLWSPSVDPSDIFPAPKGVSATPPITLDSGNQGYILSPSSFLFSPTTRRGLTHSLTYLIKRIQPYSGVMSDLETYPFCELS